MAAEASAPVPIRERTVDFYGDQVLAVLVEEDGEQQVYVPLKPICEYLGLGWGSQYNRLRRDEILSEATRGIFIMKTPEGGGRQEATCLPLKLLPGWLFGITPSKARPELREKLLRYRRECFEVLWRAFQSEALARQPGVSPDAAMLIQVRETALAVAALADQQLALQAQQAELGGRLDRAAEAFKAMDRRVSTIERRIAAGPITEEQAAEVSARVKALAEYLSSREPGTAGAGHDQVAHRGSQVHYQAIFGELYRRFGVTSYKAIPIEQFGEVMQFLEEWRMATL